MKGFIDDLAGAVGDIIKFILTSLGYFLAGMLIVSSVFGVILLAVRLIF